MELKRREGESVSAFLYRFSKKMQHTGILKEAKKRRSYPRAINKNKRRVAAIYRDEKRVEIETAKKLGTF
jgi:ribosomal protein S21